MNKKSFGKKIDIYLFNESSNRKITMSGMSFTKARYKSFGISWTTNQMGRPFAIFADFSWS
jgi:hypothetical protein